VLQDWNHGVLTGPVALTMTFTLVRPPSVSAKRRPQPTVKPDLSKLYRAAEDAMTGIVFVDDAQVVEATVRKVYGETPGLACEIRWDAG
jgi:Holliday junction resolvase RusA-like endonuclease